MVLAALFVMAPTALRIEVKPYGMWPKAIHAVSAELEIVFVPEVGRLMHFARPGGKNWLWESPRTDGKPLNTGGWKNWGGDKLWPAPQSLWGWPPDPELDGAPMAYKLLSDGFSVFGKPSAKSGLAFERTFRVVPGTARLQIVNHMRNTGAKPQKLAVWQICQLDAPDRVWISSIKFRPYPGKSTPSVYFSPVPGKDQIEILRDPYDGRKYGAKGLAGELVAFRGAERLVMRHEVDVNREYPDSDRAQQVYTNPEPHHYVELELNAPLKTLLPGETQTLKTELDLR
jgi:hypothetical protein